MFNFAKTRISRKRKIRFGDVCWLIGMFNERGKERIKLRVRYVCKIKLKVFFFFFFLIIMIKVMENNKKKEKK